MKTLRFFYIVGWLSIVMGIALIAIVTYWIIWPYKALVFNDMRFRVLTPVVKQGGTLVYVSDYCKYVPLSAVLSHTFINGLIFSTPEQTTNRETGCHVITVGVPIPHELPPGAYRLQNIYKYHINPIRTLIITHETDTFTVEEAK